jgi:hypothetical protein
MTPDVREIANIHLERTKMKKGVRTFKSRKDSDECFSHTTNLRGFLEILVNCYGDTTIGRYPLIDHDRK